MRLPFIFALSVALTLPGLAQAEDSHHESNPGMSNATGNKPAALKKLPGKKKPPTLTLKRGKNQN